MFTAVLNPNDFQIKKSNHKINDSIEKEEEEENVERARTHTLFRMKHVNRIFTIYLRFSINSQWLKMIKLLQNKTQRVNFYSGENRVKKTPLLFAE